MLTFRKSTIKIGIIYAICYYRIMNMLQECFFNPSIELYREHTLEHMGALWAAWRSSLNVDYVRPCKTKGEVIKNVPQGFNANDWEWLVTNKFLTDEFQV